MEVNNIFNVFDEYLGTLCFTMDTIWKKITIGFQNKNFKYKIFK